MYGLRCAIRHHHDGRSFLEAVFLANLKVVETIVAISSRLTAMWAIPVFIRGTAILSAKDLAAKLALVDQTFNCGFPTVGAIHREEID